MNRYKVALAGLLIALPSSQPLHAAVPPTAGEVLRSLAIMIGCGYMVGVFVGHSIPSTNRVLQDTGLFKHKAIKSNVKEAGILITAFLARLPMHNFLADRLARLYMNARRTGNDLNLVKESWWGKFAWANAFDVRALAEDGLIRAGGDSESQTRRNRPLAKQAQEALTALRAEH
ncbi:hypothetical protein JW872_01435 [Candidatus Babeliales bacterium]|nr:hypothetical protein [Candidatus Babeliales bacterium]